MDNDGRSRDVGFRIIKVHDTATDKDLCRLDVLMGSYQFNATIPDVGGPLALKSPPSGIVGGQSFNVRSQDLSRALRNLAAEIDRNVAPD